MKYIIDTENICDGFCKDKNSSMVFSDKILKKLEKYDESTEYKRGLEDAWEIAGRVRKTTMSERLEIFGTKEMDYVFIRSANEAISKFKAYDDKKKEICVGDVVKRKDYHGANYIVTGVFEYWLNAVNMQNGGAGQIYKRDCEKTGKHYDLKKMFDLDNDRKE